MESIQKSIQKARHDIRDSTLKEYLAKIRSAYKFITGKNESPKDLDFLKYPDQVRDALEKKYLPNTTKAYYNAFSVALQAIGENKLAGEYGVKRDEKQDQYTEQAKSGEPTEKQKKYMVSLERIDRLLNRLKEDVDDVYSEGDISKRDMNFIQNYLMLLIHRHIPLRNELAHIEIISDTEYDKMNTKKRDQHNYLVVVKKGKGKRLKRSFELRLNNYKTSKTHGERVIEIPEELKLEMTRWLMVNNDPFLFLNKSRTGPMTSSQYSSRFSKFMEQHLRGKNISSNAMRHIYLSDKFGDVSREMKETAEMMGHSSETQKLYIKNK